jgi:hypothetical protein
MGRGVVRERERMRTGERSGGGGGRGDTVYARRIKFKFMNLDPD